MDLCQWYSPFLRNLLRVRLIDHLPDALHQRRGRQSADPDAPDRRGAAPAGSSACRKSPLPGGTGAPSDPWPRCTPAGCSRQCAQRSAPAPDLAPAELAVAGARPLGKNPQQAAAVDDFLRLVNRTGIALTAFDRERAEQPADDQRENLPRNSSALAMKKTWRFWHISRYTGSISEMWLQHRMVRSSGVWAGMFSFP